MVFVTLEQFNMGGSLIYITCNYKWNQEIAVDEPTLSVFFNVGTILIALSGVCGYYNYAYCYSHFYYGNWAIEYDKTPIHSIYLQ